MIAALDLDRRLQRASHAAAYLVVNVPIAILGALAVLALVIGAALSVAWIGLPLLLGAAAACRRLVRLDRRAANRLLGTHIPPVPAGVATAGSPWRRSLDILSDRALWRMVALLATKPLLIAGLCIVALVPLALLAEILSLGVQGVAGLGTIDYLGPWRLGPALGLVLLRAGPGAPRCWRSRRSTRCTRCCARSGARCCRPAPRRERTGARDAGREPRRPHGVDRLLAARPRGASSTRPAIPVALPEPGSGRAWTAVEQRRAPRSRRSSTTPRSTRAPSSSQAAAAASSLAIDNERLKADLRARVEELRVSRAADRRGRRRRPPAHRARPPRRRPAAARGARARAAGAQARLDRRSRGRAARRRARGAARAPRSSELRELARGIHPAILTDAAASMPAIAALADRAPVPVAVEIAIDGRLAPAGRGRRLLRRGRGADQRRALRAGDRERASSCARDGDGASSWSSPTTASAAPTSTPAAGCAGCRTASRPSTATLAIDSPPGAGTRLRGDDPLAGGRDAASRRRGDARALALLVALPRRLRRDDATCASAPSWSRPASRGERAADVRAPQRAACASRSSRTGRRRARSGPSCATASRPPRARSTSSSTTARPTSTACARMEALIDQAVASRPDGLVVSIPEPGLAPAIRRAVQGRHPGRLDQLGQRRLPPLGVLAHVGQPEEPRRPRAGERLAAAGVRRALCVNQQIGNKGLDARCRGLARAMRARRRRARSVLGVDDQSPATPRKIADAVRSGRIDGVLALNATSGIEAVKAPGSSAARAARRSPRSISAPTCCAPCAPASCSSRSTSRPTCRATCRSCCSPSARATACSRPRATSCPPARTSSRARDAGKAIELSKRSIR